ncbi:MAG TPA: GGDEF domain-containing phosphodiesterase, partial [Mycobacteriales bacterium]|nr:GGDEF domain-containing phosphodiesterase [Mycobacteriales bacterium]
VQGHTIVTSISIGVAVRTPGVGSRELLGSADRALYESKRRGRDCIATAQEPDPMPPDVAVGLRRAAPGVLTKHPAAHRSRVRPTQDPFTELVASALHEQRLQVDYQPVVELNEGRIIGVEALLRMRDRNGRVVMPDTFIPLAEATGDIHEFGSWILMEAARQTQIWKRQLPADADFCLGVNLSPRQVDDPHLLDRVDEALAASRLDPSALALELTERIPIGNSTAGRRNLHEIRDRGVHLACDDFGAGHAGPQQIHELPFDIIKIDRMWTSRLALEDGPPTRLARGILRLAKATELVVIAEGVETERERLALLAEGCQLAQGYLFSRPQAPADITAYLRAQGGSDTGPRDEIGGSALAP